MLSRRGRRTAGAKERHRDKRQAQSDSVDDTKGVSLVPWKAGIDTSIRSLLLGGSANIRTGEELHSVTHIPHCTRIRPFATKYVFYGGTV